MRRIAALLMLIAVVALARADHDLHHAAYKSWINRNNVNCCNDRDCGTIADVDIDESHGPTRVRIEGEWCQVTPAHYLKSGNAPNWDSAHVCVLKADGRAPCQRFICFQPRPKG